MKPMNTKDIAPTLAGSKILLYGPSGMGKTTGAATFPKPYFFDMDNKIRVVAGKDIDYNLYVDGDPARPTAWNTLINHTNQLIKDCPYETVVYDSLTTMSDIVLNQAQRVSGTSGRLPEIQDYRMQADMIHQFLVTKLNMLAEKATVILIAHEQIIKDDITGQVFVQPAVTGKRLPVRLPLWFNEVWRATVEEVKGERQYLIQTKSDRRYSAMTSLKGLDIKEQLDYGHIMSKIKEAA